MRGKGWGVWEGFWMWGALVQARDEYIQIGVES